MWHGKHSRLRIGINVGFNKSGHCVDRLRDVVHWLAHHSGVGYKEDLA